MNEKKNSALGPRIVLSLDSALFAAFGLLYVFFPTQMAEKVGIHMATPGAVIDLQGLYGGLELGVGSYLGLCSFKPELYRTGLMVGSFALGGIAATRLIGVIQAGLPDPTVLSLLGLDLLGAFLNIYFLRKLPLV